MLSIQISFLPSLQRFTKERRHLDHAAKSILCICLCGLLGLRATAADETSTPDLADLTIQQLMNESVTSVSKKETPLDQSPAAIFVVTPDDIRRLGITSIPEALRLVPGMDVAQIGASQWAISSRGFNNQFANKLLVMIDGRTVYDPSFAGVFWDVQNVVMEDIDRIEVIRGPGAALWGANAVDGVVNVITKSARETQGMLVSTSYGSLEQPSTTVRYGGKLGPDLYYRAYVQYFSEGAFEDSSGHDAHDPWSATQGGFRLDWEPSTMDTLTLQGDYYYSQEAGDYNIPQLTPPYSQTLHLIDYNSGGNILGRWTHRFSDTSQLTVQSYFDHSSQMFDAGRETNDTGDLDVQHRFALGTRNDIVWGFGYRHTVSDIPPSPILTATPERLGINLYTAFIQDQIAVVPDRFSLILGSKLEHNDFTGFEFEPSGRLLWTPGATQTVWMGVSRAVRTPSRLDTDLRYNAAVIPPSPQSPPVEVVNFGNPDLLSEKVYTYELGYRVEPARQLSVDTTVFYNIYDQIEGTIQGQPYLEATHIVSPQISANNQSGDGYGTEVSLQWKVTTHWRLGADYSWLQMRLHPDPSVAGNSPKNQAHLRSYVDLPFNTEFNSSISYVDSLETSEIAQHIPAYVRLDLGLVWHASKSLELGVWGDNLLKSRHEEFSNLTGSTTEIPRSVLLKMTWSF